MRKKFYCKVFDSIEMNMLVYESYFSQFDSSNHFLVMVGETRATFLLRCAGHAVLMGDTRNVHNLDFRL